MKREIVSVYNEVPGEPRFLGYRSCTYLHFKLVVICIEGGAQYLNELSLSFLHPEFVL